MQSEAGLLGETDLLHLLLTLFFQVQVPHTNLLVFFPMGLLALPITTHGLFARTSLDRGLRFVALRARNGHWLG